MNKVIKRDKSTVDFDIKKIKNAIQKAFIATYQDNLTAEYIDEISGHLADFVAKKLVFPVSVELIQDKVEETLMISHQKVARAYILYREKQSQKRQKDDWYVDFINDLLVDFESSHIDVDRLHKLVKESSFEGMSDEVRKVAVEISLTALFELHYDYSRLAAKLEIDHLTRSINERDEFYSNEFGELLSYIAHGVKDHRLDPRMLDFNFEELQDHICHDRNQLFDYQGIKTLIDRYFLRDEIGIYESPQHFFMRVAMGLALNEKPEARTQYAVAFYDVMSLFEYMPSTPTLFNSGTVRPQLASCFLTTIPDSLDGIYSCLSDNAKISKWCGGIGNDWTNIRGFGSPIKGTGGKSQGVVPFLKVFNDSAIAVNQGGKRKGAVCAYLETWHIDVEEFLELRKNTGDDRRRTHDMNTANWIPDLFMQRKEEGGDWTLFSPDDVPALHDAYGDEFKKLYEEYEKLADDGAIKVFKRVKAVDLWRKMLGMLYETGHPWICFKDTCNLKNPQKHCGVIHSSNLCTEITEITSFNETAVCNLGSVNLMAHVKSSGDLDKQKLKATVTIAVRMLDNVIDINYYPDDKAKKSNLRHRPIGLGMMGFHDFLQNKDVSFDDRDSSIEVSKMIGKCLSDFAIQASMNLAKERGSYETFQGSSWSKGLMPNGRFHDDLRGGMRNSLVCAIAPTATIANIVGVSNSIDPHYKNLYAKDNLSGSFVRLNKQLVDKLISIDLWDEVMINEIKMNDGSIQNIDRIPSSVREIYKTAFEINPLSLVDNAAARQEYIDQSQSLNLYAVNPNGKLLDEIYTRAWKLGIKTTYYLRVLGASSAEKSTVDHQLNTVKACNIDDPDCEACQ